MKHFMTALVLMTALISCGSKPQGHAGTADADSTQTHSIGNETSQVKVFGDPQADYCVATIQNDGSVTLKFNQALCDKLAEAMNMPNRMGGSEATIEGLAETCKDIVPANLGNDVNPFLVMLTEQGHVAIFSIIDALSTGDMACSGPLHGLDDIVELRLESDVDGQGVYAKAEDGTEKWVDANGEMEGYYNMGNFEIHLSIDWNITMSDTDTDYFAEGTFYIDPEKIADGPGMSSRELVANLGDNTCRIAIYHDWNDESYELTFKADRDFPLEQDRPISFKRNYASQIAD